MRFAYLLVAVATLLASRDAVAATRDADQTQFSMVNSLAAAVSGHPLDAASEKRFLRSHDTHNAAEERAVMPSAEWTEKWAKKTAVWVEKGNYPSLIKKYLGPEKVAILGSKARAKYNLFNAAFLKKYPSGFNLNGEN